MITTRASHMSKRCGRSWGETAAAAAARARGLWTRDDSLPRQNPNRLIIGSTGFDQLPFFGDQECLVAYRLRLGGWWLMENTPDEDRWRPGVLPRLRELTELSAGRGEVNAGDFELSVADDHRRPDAEGTANRLRH